jgi:hypothetical protein
MIPTSQFSRGRTRISGWVQYNGIFTTEEKLGMQGEWFVKGDLDQIAKKYKDWDPRLLKLLKLVKPEDCYIWNITDLPSLPTWSKGRTVLIGDAAHATLPFLGLVSKLLSRARVILICLYREQQPLSKTERVSPNVWIARSLLRISLAY